MFLILTWSLGKRWILGSLLILFVLSFSLTYWGAYNHPTATFYLLPTRGWELLLGVFVGFYFNAKNSHSFSNKSNQVFSIFGLILIFYSIFSYNYQILPQSLFILIPTLGTALLIIFVNKDTFVYHILSNRLMVSIGLISYSAYLWQQPLFVFAKYRMFSKPSEYLMVILCVAIFPLAYFSWRFVEKPFRQKNLISRNFIFLFSVIVATLFIGLGFYGHFTNGFEKRVSIPQSVKESFRGSDRATACFARSKVHLRDDWLCDLGDEKTNHSFFVLGDSHAWSLFESMSTASKKEGKRGYFTGADGCTPFLGIYALRSDQNEKNCYELNNRTFNFIKKNNNITKLFLIARWTYYTEQWNTDHSYISLKINGKPSLEESRKAFISGLKETVAAYLSIGVEVVIVFEVPLQLNDPQKIFTYAYLYKGTEDDILNTLRNLSLSVEQNNLQQRYVLNLFSPYVSEGRIVLLNLNDLFCFDGKCLIGDTDYSFYYDDDHLSVKGSEFVIQSLRNVFK